MGILDFLFKGSGFGRRSVSPMMQNRISMDWKHIDTQLRGGGPSQLRQALITADKTLDSALKDLVNGETMADRLKNAQTMFDKVLYDKVWKAHKMRNALVHEAGYEPTHDMLRTSVNTLREAIIKVGVRL